MKDGDGRTQAGALRRPTTSAASERPWNDDWLRERFYTHYPLRASRFAVPRVAQYPGARQPAPAQLRALRGRELGVYSSDGPVTGTT